MGGAHLAWPNPGHILDTLIQLLAHRVQESGPLGMGQARPRAVVERSAGRRHSAVDVRFHGSRDTDVHLLRCRINDVNPPAGLRLNPLPVNEQIFRARNRRRRRR
jgi:hypothetical protein